ncbi:MAG: hypothetical protein CMC04_11055 [Flavobacteriaceae bacterium]|nr:hypothetical protein [Flavobacteriaceae bacterium]
MRIIKYFLIILTLTTLSTCKEEINETPCSEEYPYKAKLAIKGICFNYVIELVDGGPISDLVEYEWTDEMSGKVYNNVFRLSNYCNFPPDIEEGEEFYFDIVNVPTDNLCMVCMAYRPTPEKAIDINVCEL